MTHSQERFDQKAARGLRSRCSHWIAAAGRRIEGPLHGNIVGRWGALLHAASVWHTPAGPRQHRHSSLATVAHERDAARADETTGARGACAEGAAVPRSFLDCIRRAAGSDETHTDRYSIQDVSSTCLLFSPFDWSQGAPGCAAGSELGSTRRPVCDPSG